MGNNQIFTKPHNGTCWSSVFAPSGFVQEPLPMLACLFVAALGLFGMLQSWRVTEGGKLLYSAMFGYRWTRSMACVHWVGLLLHDDPHSLLTSSKPACLLLSPRLAPEQAFRCFRSGAIRLQRNAQGNNTKEGNLTVCVLLLLVPAVSLEIHVTILRCFFLT